MSCLVRLFSALHNPLKSARGGQRNGTRFVSYDNKLHNLKPLEDAPNYFQTTVRNTDVAKDVMLYGLNHGRFFKYMTLFAAVQFIFWGQLSYYSLQNYVRLKRRKAGASQAESAESTESQLAKPEEVASENRKVDSDEKKERWYVKRVMGHVSSDRAYYSLATGSAYFFFGALVTYGLMFYCLRTIHSLILLRGGKKVTITTFAPFGFTRSFTVPLEDLTTRLGRQGVAAFLPIKIRGRASSFLVDMRGTFFNPALFDVTAGLQRSWRK